MALWLFMCGECVGVEVMAYSVVCSFPGMKVCIHDEVKTRTSYSLMLYSHVGEAFLTGGKSVRERVKLYWPTVSRVY